MSAATQKPVKRLTPEQTVVMLSQQRDAFLQEVTVPEIETDEQYAIVTEAWKRGKDFERMVENTRKVMVAPANEQVKTINDMFRKVGVPLATRIQALASAMSSYDRKKALERAEHQRLLNEASRQQHEEAQKSGQGTPLPVAVAPILPSETRKVTTEAGTVSMIDNWKVAVTEAAAVPVMYWSVDPKKLQAAVDTGVRDIPGCYIYNEPYPRSGRA